MVVFLVRDTNFVVVRVIECCNTIGLELVGFRISSLSTNRIAEFPGPEPPKIYFIVLHLHTSCTFAGLKIVQRLTSVVKLFVCQNWGGGNEAVFWVLESFLLIGAHP